MSTAPQDDVSKRLIASVLQFLESEIQRTDLDDEIKQSVDVSRQCLQSAYTMTSADVPTGQQTLKDLFLAACPAPVSVVKSVIKVTVQLHGVPIKTPDFSFITTALFFSTCNFIIYGCGVKMWILTNLSLI